jgi:uncharacterized protein (DUF2252 family)
MNIFKATADFEHWLAGQLPIIRQDLALKHQHMAEAAFPFFRATFYRWLQLWPEHCVDLMKAPAVLGVGDLHIENFGTWRDEEGPSFGASTIWTKPGPRRMCSIWCA